MDAVHGGTFMLILNRHKNESIMIGDDIKLTIIRHRHKNESIMIGDDIKLTIIRLGESQVKIGIDAPPNVPVHRQEIYDAIKAAENATS